MAYKKSGMKKKGNPSAASPMDKKFLGKGSTGPNAPSHSPGSVQGQDHLSQEQIKKPVEYKDA